MLSMGLKGRVKGNRVGIWRKVAVKLEGKSSGSHVKLELLLLRKKY